MKNRRAHSRVQVPEGTLQARMDGRRGEVAGPIVNASAGGIHVAFPSRPNPVAALGTDITLELFGPALPEPVKIKVIVCHRMEREDGVYYGFQLHDPSVLGGAIPRDLFPVFNRRVEQRVDAEKPLDIPILLSTYGTDGHHTAAARVLDLSTVGVAVLVDASTEWMFATTRYVTAAIQLTSLSRSPPVTIECQIRNRKLIENDIRYGMAFVEKRTDQFPLKRKQIVNYLEPWNRDFG